MLCVPEAGEVPGTSRMLVGWMDEWIDGYGWMWMDDGSMDGWVNGWIWMGGFMD